MRRFCYEKNNREHTVFSAQFLIKYMQIQEDNMHIFDYSFLDEGLLPAEIVNLTATITAFNAI